MLCKKHMELEWKEIRSNVQVTHFDSCIKNQKIYVKRQLGKGSTTIFLFHDIGSYHGRFNHLLNWFQGEHPEFNFVMMDFAGHGLSSGTRGHVSHMNDLIADVSALLESIDKKSSEKWVMLGHGLGALVLLDLLNRVEGTVKNKIDSLILSNFMLHFESPGFNLQNRIYEKFNLAGKESMDHFRLLEIYPSADMLSFRREQLEYLQDPLIVHRPTLSSLRAIVQKVRHIYQDSYFLDKPTLVLESTGPSLIENGTDSFARGLKKNLLTQKKYSFLKHDLYNESEKEIVFKDIAEWVSKA